MRAIFVSICIVIGAAYSLKGPFQALLFYLWIAYFRPVSWVGWIEFFQTLNLSFNVGALMLVTTILTRQRFRFGVGPFLMLLYLSHSLVSVLASPVSETAWIFWRFFAPSVIFGYLMVVLITDEARLRLVLVTIALSLGIEQAKQGWADFFVHPGGQNLNFHNMLGDNNLMAVGMLMLVPLLLALARTTTGKYAKYERILHQVLAVGILYRAIVTYSRGGFLACGGLGLHYLLRSKRKFGAVVAIIAMAALVTPVLPTAFWDRMETIFVSADRLDSAEADRSILGRLHFWDVALVMVSDRPLTGVGFNAFSLMYDRYDFSHGDFGARRAVHSMWFGTLAELGYPGFFMLVMLLIYAFNSCRLARKVAKTRPDLENFAAYANSIEAGLVVVIIGGSFVNFQYTEMFWHYMALAIVVRQLVRNRLAADVPAPATVPAAAVAAMPAIAPRARVRLPRVTPSEV